MKRILALDLGDKRIGIAVSDQQCIIAQPVGFIKRTNLRNDIGALKNHIDSFKANKVIVGLPKSLNGSIGPRAKLVLEFTQRLKEELEQEIIVWDERFTTSQAEKVLIQGNVKRRKRKSLVDKLAAVLILQSYLDYLAENYLNEQISKETK